MNTDIYQKGLMRIAAAAKGHGRLQHPDGTANLDNPMCGDQVTIDVSLTNDAIGEIAQEVRACVLCQASASILGAHATGQKTGDISVLKHQVEAMLRKTDAADTAPAFTGIWADFNLFQPVAPHKSRHNCVLLPIQALETAITQAQEHTAPPAPAHQTTA